MILLQFGLYLSVNKWLGFHENSIIGVYLDKEVHDKFQKQSGPDPKLIPFGAGMRSSSAVVIFVHKRIY